jgi:hypothetical protein
VVFCHAKNLLFTNFRLLSSLSKRTVQLEVFAPLWSLTNTAKDLLDIIEFGLFHWKTLWRRNVRFVMTKNDHDGQTCGGRNTKVFPSTLFCLLQFRFFKSLRYWCCMQLHAQKYVLISRQIFTSLHFK